MFPSTLSTVTSLIIIATMVLRGPIQQFMDRYDAVIKVVMAAAGLIVLYELGLLGVIAL